MKPYPTYKDSRTEWMGEIPSEWEIIKLKYIMRNFDGKRIPLSSEQRAEMQGDYPYYGANGIVDRVNNYLFDGEYILLGEDGAPFFEPYKDVAFLVKGKFWVNNHAHILKAIQNYDQRFLTYLLNRVDYRKYITGSTRDKLTQDDMSSIELPVMVHSEQKTIATYLDRKTAQIDDLIAKKKRMIELLKEERTAVINQAVTKGLDPNVELKDSGIEWLGKIPKHWKIKKLKYIAHVETGITPPSDDLEYYENGELNWFTPGDFNDMILLIDSNRKINHVSVQNGVAKIYEPFSVLLVGIGANLGKIGIIDKEASSNQQINAITFKKGFNPFYGVFYLKSISKIIVSLSNASTLAILNQSQTRGILIVIPPLEEQDAIAEFVKSVDKKVNDVISKEKSKIEYLKEYRTALISEVVTGKIDVREE